MAIKSVLLFLVVVAKVIYGSEDGNNEPREESNVVPYNALLTAVLTAEDPKNSFYYKLTTDIGDNIFDYLEYDSILLSRPLQSDYIKKLTNTKLKKRNTPAIL